MPGSFNPPTIQGAIKRQTQNYNFLVPVFDAPGWGTAIERNWDVIDSVLFSITGIGNVQGAWDNSVVYSIAARVVDVTDNTLWQSYVAHTSAASGSFSDDRAAHPTYWKEVINGSVPRGDWETDTEYNAGEIVTDNGRTGVIAQQFTSTTSYDDDVTDGNIITIVDVAAFQSFNTAISSANVKTTFHNNDRFGIADSEDSNALKAVTWSGIKANVKVYTDTLYQPLSAVLTATTASFLIADETKLDGIEALADVTDAVNVAAAANSTASKATPADNDRVYANDSDDGNALKWFTWTNIKSAIRTYLTDLLVPTGTIHAFAFDDTSTTYLDCDGAAVSRSTYSALFAKIGTTWGAGNGSTTFNVPDFRDEFLRGNSGTRAIGSSASDSLKSHTHTLTMDAVEPHTHTIGPTQGRFGANSDPQSVFRPSAGDSNGSTVTGNINAGGGHTPTGTIGSTGGTETAPRHKVVKFRIKI